VRKARRFPPEFRHEAVELYRNSDRSLEQVAKELGIGTSTLARWHYKLAPGGTGPAAGIRFRSRFRG
jgi:transposase